jgi:hypothetical protein
LTIRGWPGLRKEKRKALIINPLYVILATRHAIVTFSLRTLETPGDLTHI